MRERLAGTLFALLCTGGAVAALGLAVHEAQQKAPVHAGIATTTREGLATVASVDVRNRTAAARCVQLRVVAQDREGRDLGSSGSSRLRLEAHGRVVVPERLELSARQYAEQLVGFRAVLDGCGAERPMQK